MQLPWKIAAIGAMLMGCQPQASTTATPKEEVVVKETTSTHAFPLNDDPCNAETATRLSAWFAAWHQWHQDGAQLPAPKTSYPVFDGARIPENHILVSVSGGRVFVENTVSFETTYSEDGPMPTRHWHSSLMESLRQATMKLKERRMDTSETRIVLAFEEDTPGDVVRNILYIVLERALVVAFQAPEIEERFQAPGDVRERHADYYAPGREIRALAERAVQEQECKEMAQFGLVLEKTTPSQRWKYFESDFGPTWVTCGCKGLDVEQRLVALSSPYTREPLATSHPLNLSVDGEPFVMSDDTTWKDIAPRIREQSGPIYPVKKEGEKAPGSAPAGPLKDVF